VVAKTIDNCWPLGRRVPMVPELDWSGKLQRLVLAGSACGGCKEWPWGLL